AGAVVRTVVSVQIGLAIGKEMPEKKGTPKWRNGRRAGLKIRSTQVGVGSSPTFGTRVLRQIWGRVGKSVPPRFLQRPARIWVVPCERSVAFEPGPMTARRS